MSGQVRDVSGRVSRLAELQVRRVLELMRGGDLPRDELDELEALERDDEVLAMLREREVARERRDTRGEHSVRYQRIIDSRIPIDDRDSTARRIAADEIDETRAVRAVRWWLDDERRRSTRTLVLLGPSGAGKTFAAACAISRLGGRYTKARELCRAFRAGFGPARDEWERLLEARLVVIDDFGDADRVATLRDAWRELIEARHADGSRTLVLASLDRERFDARCDDRTRARLAARGVVVELDPGPPPGLRAVHHGPVAAGSQGSPSEPRGCPRTPGSSVGLPDHRPAKNGLYSGV